MRQGTTVIQTKPKLALPALAVSPWVFLPGMLLALALPASQTASAATIEFLSGAKVECKVLSKDDKTVTVEAEIGGKTVKKTYPLSSIHVVSINDKRYVINEKPAPGSTGSRPASGSKTGDSIDSGGNPAGSAAEGGAARRTKAEIDALIDKLGREPPDWFEATPLNFPKSLDLTWPAKPPGGWDNQRNVGQYVWDVINPNPGKWREGVRLMHHLITLDPGNVERRTRIMNEIGRMYHHLLEDYARAAFWWRQAGVEKSTDQPGLKVHLADCYWRLGNKQMALDALGKLSSFPAHAVKLYADMGEMPKALQLADAYGKNPGAGADLAYMYIANGYRQQGKTKEAVAYFQKVLDIPAADPGKGRIERSHRMAQASLEAVKLMDLADVGKVRDGSYTAQSLGYEGDVQISVTVAGGRITACRVTQHREKQFYSSLTDTPAKIIAKQGVKGVDATSGATITSEAIINATAKALASGAR